MSINKKQISPRQKMINLMYLLLMGMLALNVSSDVLNGFSLVDESLSRSTTSAAQKNDALYADLEQQMKQNPAKAKEWLDKAATVKRLSDSIFQAVEQMKTDIVKQADGKDGDVKNIQRADNLEASTYVMLTQGNGKKLHQMLDNYRKHLTTLLASADKKDAVERILSTDVPSKGVTLGKNWEEYMFENMPVAASVTLLTKLQNDVRYAEGDVMHELASNVGLNDVRVNALEAYVIPNAQTIIQGGKLSAQIVMAAVDTTQRPSIYVGGTKLNSTNGRYEITCGKTGDFNLSGYIETKNGYGETVKRNFTLPYSVVAPAATVSADLMNMLYAGYANPISISIPGVPVNKIAASMQGGTLTPTGPGKYIARPTAVGKDAIITVSSNMNGKMQQMGQFTFHVRRLPDPNAFIEYKDADGPHRYRGGSPLPKNVLMSTGGIGAAIDDGLLNIGFKVVGFETVFYDNMGNAVPEISNSDSFTERQKEIFRKLSRGRRFYISRVRAVGPDGMERKLPGSLEVIVN